MLGWVNEWISGRIDRRTDRVLLKEAQARVSGLLATSSKLPFPVEN